MGLQKQPRAKAGNGVYSRDRTDCRLRFQAREYPPEKVIKTGRQVFVKVQAQRHVSLDQILKTMRAFEPPPE